MRESVSEWFAYLYFTFPLVSDSHDQCSAMRQQKSGPTINISLFN